VVPSMFPSGNGWDSSDVPAEESVAPKGKLYFLHVLSFWLLRFLEVQS